MSLTLFHCSLPRSASGEGENLTIMEIRPTGHVIITDGERSAAYEPREGSPLEGKNLWIVPGDVEPGYFSEANVLALTDGEQTTKYEPSGREEARMNSRALRPLPRQALR
jgi:hypothetical protein